LPDKQAQLDEGKEINWLKKVRVGEKEEIGRQLDLVMNDVIAL